ncbi:flagellar hook-associated protein FlgL [Clostridium sp. KNHs214]|uniref:flagellar hook-associated protein FlgL n=1 Tax=Clostridium sp. KNHs214 TaxID=1540257 RepID=UPI00054F00FB|nr:flagellar hook-associated protein FlgL [Clostridium sp. KNHs214]
MRITNKMLSNNFLRDMRTNLTNLKTLQEQMTSGKSVRRPSDNPFKVARAMQLHTEINSNKQYNENIKDTLNWLDTTDTALGQAGDIFHRIRELLISSGNGTYSAGERRAAKDEINEKISEFSQVMNTNFDGKYIFGGTRGTTKPMDTIGGSSFVGAAETNALNFSGTSSLTEADKTLVSEMKIKFQIGTDTTDHEITIGSNEVINNLRDLADKLNNKIQADNNLKGKIEVVANIANNRLEFKNRTSDKIKISNEVTALGITANTKIESNKSINSTSLNLSGADSLTTNGSLNNDLKIEVGSQQIIIKKDTPVSSLSDLASKINEQIANNDNIKDKVKVVTNLADGILKFVNTDAKDKKEIEITSSKLFGATNTKKATFNENNNENTRLLYYKKGGGELIGGSEYQHIGEKLKVEVSQGVVFTYNVSAKEIIEFKNADGETKDLRDIFKNIVNHLDGKNEDGTALDEESVKKLVNEDLKDINDAMNNILKVRSEVGAKQNSMESANDKNKDQNFNMTEILSKTEDIDITETTMQFATAQTVYIASLQTSARVLQPTLIDYIR